MKMTMDASDSARLGLNLNLSVQPQSYRWIQSPKGTDDEDEDDRRRVDDDCSPEEEPDILEMQREEQETLNQLARRLTSGSHGLMGGSHAASMIQHLVYRHPNGLPASDQLMMPMIQTSRRPSDVESPPGSSRSGDTTPLGQDFPSENDSSLLVRKGEAQSWTFEEQFRQLYTAGNETDRRSFLDSLFSYMQEQGTPISRLPIMAKRVLDLYTLYKLVVQRGGIVAVITKKLWQEIIRGLGLPPSITSAAFTLRTQYVKYLYAYESKMNQFSSVDELNMAIAGNRREGRRNKSLLSEYLPALQPTLGHPHHHHQQQHQQHHLHHHSLSAAGPAAAAHHHYANVLAADDRFRHLAAAIIDNGHRAAAVAAAAEQARHQQQPSQPPPPPPPPPQSQLPPSRPPSGASSPQRPPSGAEQPLPFNGHQQLSPYQPVAPSAIGHQVGDQANKQRELLSMLMWMDLMRANQTGMPRLSLPNLQSNPSPYATAMNLCPTVLQKETVPEQCEALNLGKKNRNTNNNNAGENDDEPSAKRIKTERSSSSPSAVSRRSPEDVGSKTVSSPRAVSSEREPHSPGPRAEEAIEMDVEVTAGLSTGLKICVSRRTKNGIYKGQLVKVESALNGGTKNTSPFILRLNGDLYTGCLQLQNSFNHNDNANFT